MLPPGCGDASACLKLTHPGDPPRPQALDQFPCPSEGRGSRGNLRL